MAYDLKTKIKPCYTCSEEKSLDNFYVSKNTTDGLQGECKTCTKQRMSVRRSELQSRETIPYPKSKKCRICKEIKTSTKFYKQHANLDGLQGRCISCVKENLYSMTGYEDLIQEQEARCAICTQELIIPCVDHDHKTGKVRGVLCTQCNIAIGLLNDNVDTLTAAIAYLIRSES